jgi:predicted DNA binding CopG/RHH family protein
MKSVRFEGDKEKGGKYMKTRIKYADEPFGELKVMKDFLPTPAQLILKDENVKITIALKKSSIEFFKNEAKKHNTSYQKMIRQLLDWYAVNHTKSA